MVEGVVAGSPVVVSLGSADGLDVALESMELQADGPYTFSNLSAHVYWIKMEGTGYATAHAQEIAPPEVDTSPQRRRRTREDLHATEFDDYPTVAGPSLLADQSSRLRGAALNSLFSYTWQTDASRAGAAETAHIVNPPNITFLNETLTLGDDQGALTVTAQASARPLPSPHALGSLSESQPPLDSATDKLRHDYNILLANERLRWSSEFAFRLLETLEAIPQLSTRSYYAALDEQAVPPSKWILAEEHIADDIAIATNGTARTVRISSHAFVHATPQVVRLDGERGRFFSRRLHHALVRFVTNHGADTQAVQHVMSNRYGCTTLMSDALYVSLTAPTTAEDEASFQPFETHVEEPLLLLTMLEELPAGLHVVPGLAYLLRRKDGYDHPSHPKAPAVAWPTAHEQSYVEFMESGMVGELRHMRRLILHEKAHFMWANLFSAGLRADWINISGWYEDANAVSGWVTTQQTTFVSAYAHLKNPNEDMAESVSFYVENPARLQACCPEKYHFLRDRVMHGYRYVSRVRPDLTFQVLNLFPDYTYPGKIVYVSITVEGEPEESKTCTVEIRLHVLDGVFEGAQRASFRLFSEIGTYRDVYLYPVDATNSALSGQFVLSKYAKVSHPNPSPVAPALRPTRHRGECCDVGWLLATAANRAKGEQPWTDPAPYAQPTFAYLFLAPARAGPDR